MKAEIESMNVLNVIMFLFHHHIKEGAVLDTPKEDILNQLEQFGFNRSLIIKAFTWLAKLAATIKKNSLQPKATSFRVYSEYERQLINNECQGFLINLELAGILTPTTREIVITQLLELEKEGIDKSLVKWVTLIVLFNQPGQEKALVEMEYLVLNNPLDGIH